MNRSGVFFSLERVPIPTGIINMVKLGHIIVHKCACDQHMFFFYMVSYITTMLILLSYCWYISFIIIDNVNRYI